MKKEKLSYSEALTELELILKSLENTQEVDMDKISTHVKRAAELIDFCKKQLHLLDEEIQKTLETLK